MTIDTSGKWWKGSTPEDLEEYLCALSAGGYQTTEFRLSKCQCGGIRFFLEVESDEGVAKRRCEKCGIEHFICDSKEHWEEGLKTKKFKCVTCMSKVANVGVGCAWPGAEPSAVKTVRAPGHVPYAQPPTSSS